MCIRSASILYVLFTGRQPFEASARSRPPLDQWLRRLREEEPPRLAPGSRVGRDSVNRVQRRCSRRSATAARACCAASLEWNRRESARARSRAPLRDALELARRHARHCVMSRCSRNRSVRPSRSRSSSAAPHCRGLRRCHRRVALAAGTAGRRVRKRFRGAISTAPGGVSSAAGAARCSRAC